MDNQPQQRVVEYFPPATGCVGNTAFPTHPQLRILLEFVNTLGQTVYITDRTGAVFIVPSNGASTKRQLHIRKSYDTLPNVNVDVRDLTDVDVVAGDEELLAKQLDNRSSGRTRQRTVVDYTLALNDLRTMGGVLYLPNLDVQVSILSDEQTPPHPFSTRGRRDRATAAMTGEKDASGFHYRIKIIDPHNSFGPRFININGQVYRIPTTVPDPDGILHDGVWVLSSVAAVGDVEQRVKDARYYSFEEAEKALGLYRTKVEAETLGNPEDIYRREQQEFSHRLKMEEAELRNKRTLLDNERVDLERRRMEEERVLEDTRRELERERDAQKRWIQDREFRFSLLEHEYRTREQLLKQESLYQKEGYERRSLARKDRSEVVKYVPVIIAAIGGLIAAYQKWK